jgi:ankyrin repeat protein
MDPGRKRDKVSKWFKRQSPRAQAGETRAQQSSSGETSTTEAKTKKPKATETPDVPKATTAQDASTSSGNLITASAASTPETSVPPKDPPGEIAIDLWNAAYEIIKKDEPKLVESYERVLARQYNQAGEKDDKDLTDDIFARMQSSDKVTRMQVMDEVVERLTFDKKKHSNRGENAAVVVKWLDTLSKGLAPVLQAYPPASLAVAGICAAAPILIRPLEQTTAMVHGLTHVIDSLEWYLALSQLLLRENYAGNWDFSTFRNLIRTRIINLYKALLNYEMKALCRCYDSWAIVQAVKDMIMVEDWKETLTKVKDLEAAVRADITEYNSKVQEDLLRKISQATHGLGEISKQLGLLVQESTEYRNMKKKRKLTAEFAAEYVKWMTFNPEHVEDTCKWFTGHKRFLSWLESESGLLLVSADPGCGKSVLSRYLVEHHFPSIAATSTVCYFFFKDQAEQKSINTGLCSVIHQLFSKHENLPLNAEKKIEEAGVTLRKNRELLWDILCQSLRESRNVILLFDALDEMEAEDLRWLTEKTKLFLESSGKETRSSIKFMFTTRGYPDITEPFEEFQAGYVRLQGEHSDELDQIQTEIGLVVSHRLERLKRRRKFPEPTFCAIEEALSKKGGEQRTYLYVSIVFEVLENEKKRYDSSAYWTRLINNMPMDLMAAYEAFLRGIDEDDLEEVRAVLAFVSAAAYPLSVHQLNAALAVWQQVQIDPNQELNTEEDLELLRSDSNFRDWLLQTCRCFLTIYRDSVYFIHQTAKEYLLGIDAKGSSNYELRWNAFLTRKKANTYLAEACIGILSIRCFRVCPVLFHNDYDGDRELAVQDRPPHFADYAWIYALSHFRVSQRFISLPHDKFHSQVEDVGDVFRKLFKNLLEFQLTSVDSWLQVYLREIFGSIIDHHIGRIVNKPSRVTTYALCGLYFLLLEELDLGQLQQSHLDGYPVLAAAVGGNSQCLNLLLAKGYPANLSAAQNRLNGRSALHWAAVWGSASMVNALLNHNGNLEATISELEGITPIYDCIPGFWDGYSIITRTLYSRKFANGLRSEGFLGHQNLETEEVFPRGARRLLSGCSESDWTKSLVKVFHDHGANLYAGNFPTTLLSEACRRGGSSIVGFLLQQCNMDIQRELSRHRDLTTPLLFGLSFNNWRITETFLKAGVGIVEVRKLRFVDGVTTLHDLCLADGEMSVKPSTLELYFTKGGRRFIDARLKIPTARRPVDYNWLPKVFEQVKDGFTPLHCFVTKGDIGSTSHFECIIDVFKKDGMDLDARDSRGWTPLHCICMNRNEIAKEMAATLLGLGADGSHPFPSGEAEGRNPIEFMTGLNVQEFLSQRDKGKLKDATRESSRLSRMYMNP